MTFYQIAVILIAHFVADFIFQSEYMAKGKAKNIKPLIQHGLMYTFIFTLMSLLMANDIKVETLVLFGLFSGILHTWVDLISSKFASRAYAKGNMGGPVPNLGFFAIIGLDQLTHYLMLFAAFNWLVL